MNETECIFCRVNANKLILEGEMGYACWDSYPVNQGHALIIPYRHFANYFDINSQEQHELWDLVKSTKKVIDEKFSPDGYNVGINVGDRAGQSIPHLHIHLIPRYQGDMENPKGGVRGVIPEKQKYQRRP